KITIPRFGAYKSDVHTAAEDVTPTERKAMIYANIALLITMVVVTFLAVPENGLLRNAKTGSLIQDSP
ncbi:AbgT family transporter, partial [Staphylococcus capitis]